MVKKIRYFFRIHLTAVTTLQLLVPFAHAAPMHEDLAAAAPRANPVVIELATRALQCASKLHPGRDNTLTVIDYSIESTKPRLWVFDLATRHLLHEELVAHGKSSGENQTTFFSNSPGSKATSIGVFRTGDTYSGENGYSLHLHGLEPGFNDNAFERAIVMHGAPYVSAHAIQELGRLGRSWGCPALRPEIAKELIDTIKNGDLIVAYYPDQVWLEESKLLNCSQLELPQSDPKRAPE